MRIYDENQALEEAIARSSIDFKELFQSGNKDLIS